MSWNHRVIYHPAKTIKLNGEDYSVNGYMGLHEIYYDENNSHSYSLEPIIVSEVDGERTEDMIKAIEELKITAGHMIDGINKAIVNGAINEDEFDE
jgi:hypothetical protein